MTRLRALATAAAVTTALAFAGAASAQDDEDDDASATPTVACGASFASSGARTPVEYASVQLRACDALVATAETAAQLEAAAAATKQAHAEVLAQWSVVMSQLVASASSTPTVNDEGDVNDPFAAALERRDAIETAMDGLRILMRLSHQLSKNFADPAKLVQALADQDTTRLPEVLAGRQVCASAGRPSIGSRPGTAPSWYAFTDLDNLEYDIEISDALAENAETFVDDGLGEAPLLGVRRLRSYDTKRECDRNTFPSERAS